MENNSINKIYNKISSNPPLVLALAFALLITLGGLLLSLPFVSKSGQATSLFDSFFTASSASCVTGLTTVNTAGHWNLYGQIIIIFLIQIGGLGVMSFASLIPLILGEKFGLKSRQILREQFNIKNLNGMIRLFRYVLIFTFSVELIGALILSISFIPKFGIKTGIWYSVFHSISAFCNAGFDILGDSIILYKDDFIINICLELLTIIGGLGFIVTGELYYKRDLKKISTHSKIVLIVTGLLILLGTLGFFILEKSGGVLADQSLGSSILQSSFQSVVARTSGFSSVDLSKIKDSTALLLITLMFIGGSPGSTAGGIKTTTFAVLILSTVSIVKGERETIVFDRHIDDQVVKKALAIFTISISIVMLLTFTLSISENFKTIDILFETVSALATVGTSKGITSDFSNLGKILITICMYIGRLGPITMGYAFGMKAKDRLHRYPESFINIG